MNKLYHYTKFIYFHRPVDKVDEKYKELVVTHYGSTINYEEVGNLARGSVLRNDLNVPKFNLAPHYFSASIYSDKSTIKNDLNYMMMQKLDDAIRTHYDQIQKLKDAKNEI